MSRRALGGGDGLPLIVSREPTATPNNGLYGSLRHADATNILKRR